MLCLSHLVLINADNNSHVYVPGKNIVSQGALRREQQRWRYGLELLDVRRIVKRTTDKLKKRQTAQHCR